MYTNLDEFYQNSVLFLAQDMSLGFGMSILILSAGLKIGLIPANIAMQKQALKMKLIEPEMKQF